MGDMADMVEDMIFFDDWDDWSDPDNKTCNRCGESGLHWEETTHGWRLFDYRDEQHECPHPDYMEPPPF